MTSATRNAECLRDARAAAEVYLERGLAPIPVPPRSKDPEYTGWQHLFLTPDTLDQHFQPHQAKNVGRSGAA
jgi:hypothetical protein